MRRPTVEPHARGGQAGAFRRQVLAGALGAVAARARNAAPPATGTECDPAPSGAPSTTAIPAATTARYGPRRNATSRTADQVETDQHAVAQRHHADLAVERRDTRDRLLLRGALPPHRVVIVVGECTPSASLAKSASAHNRP
jgi:hypothetical protein